MSTTQQQDPRFSRLRRTPTFRRDGVMRYRKSRFAVAGAGALGGRFAIEAALSGAKVSVFDFGAGSLENIGTQFVEVGAPKAERIAQSCNAIRQGSAVARAVDIRHVGVGELLACDVIVDCTDDASLTLPLVKQCNGIRRPYLRLAVDGTGETDTGRVAHSDGGNGHSCALCTHTREQVYRLTRRMSCADALGKSPELPPTLAGGPISAAVAAYGLLQSQRLTTGNDLDQVVDRQIVIDMTHGQVLSLLRRRSEKCVSGHQTWALTRLSATAGEITLAELFDFAERHFATREISIQPHGHPLCIEAVCDCGHREAAVGTRFAPPPLCSACAAAMQWFRHSALAHITRDIADELEIVRVPVAELGMPEQGAMFSAFHLHQPQPPLRVVLA